VEEIPDAVLRSTSAPGTSGRLIGTKWFATPSFFSYREMTLA
jgi:hypothetical protein